MQPLQINNNKDLQQISTALQALINSLQPEELFTHIVINRM